MLNGERRNFICPEAIALTFPRLNKCTPDIKREHGVPFGVLVLIVQICTACSQMTGNRAGSRGEHPALPRRMPRNWLPVVLFCDGRNHGLCPIGKKITCADMRDSGVHGVVVYCSDISLRAKGGHASG